MIPTFEECRQRISELAYKFWEDAGRPIGDGFDFWVMAEKQLFHPDWLKMGYMVQLSENNEVHYIVVGSSGNLRIGTRKT